MSNNLYEKVIQWANREEKESGIDGRLISTTYDETYGQDIDNNPIGDPTIIRNDNRYVEKQRYDYDVLNTIHKCRSENTPADDGRVLFAEKRFNTFKKKYEPNSFYPSICYHN